MQKNFGKLYIVATPIGNLEDMTFRAIKILSSVFVICAEDTRNTIKILNHFDIKTKMLAYHKNNRYEKIPQIIDILKEGKDIALVSDAGTPLISDPGYELVNECFREGIEVNTIPGACAAICAMTLSGLDNTTFVFQGFLSESKKEQEEMLTILEKEKRTMIFYIAPHKLLKNLDALIKHFSENRRASLSREITKIHEETLHKTLGELKKYFEEKEIKGEIVLVVEGCSENIDNIITENKNENLSIKEQVEKLVLQGLTEKDAMKEVAKKMHIDKREVYKIIKV